MKIEELTENDVIHIRNKKEALIKEAERRGFKEEAIIKCIDGKRIMLEGNHFKFNGCELYATGSIVLVEDIIFKDGKWAEIISEPEAIDFSKAGQLIECKKWGCIIMTSGKHTPHHFTGTYVVSKTAEDLGKTYDSIIKEGSTLYQGELTLSN